MAPRPSDIIVIGAGIVGCAIAEELARRGASVEIVDDRPVGMGATQASARRARAVHRSRARAARCSISTVRSLGLYDEFVARVRADSGVAVPYQRTGTIDVAMNEAEMRTLERPRGMLARRGVAGAAAGRRRRARAEEPQVGDGAVGGLLIEAHGFVGGGRSDARAARRRAATARR